MAQGLFQRRLRMMSGKGKTPPPSEEVLRDLYEIQCLKMAEIGSIYGVAANTVGRWLHNQGIGTNPDCRRTFSVPPKHELVNMYEVQGMSAKSMALIFEVSEQTVARWFAQYSIDTTPLPSRRKAERNKDGSFSLSMRGGKVTLVDAGDLDLVRGYSWSLSEGYAGTIIEGKTRRLHQLLNPIWVRTDHINRNRLDNRRCNLRESTRSQNARNQTKRQAASSVYMGVSYQKDRDNWSARVAVDGKVICLGRFDTELEAALAREAEIIRIGDVFCTRNFPEI